LSKESIKLQLENKEKTDLVNKTKQEAEEKERLAKVQKEIDEKREL
jgi:hypothetical protein